MAHSSPRTAGLELEIALWDAGKRHLFGLDEAGRGAWAGPVAAGAVCLPHRPDLTEILRGVYDSKQLRPGQRERLAGTIRQHALSWGVGFASPAEIDELGIVPATCLAMRRALDQARLSAASPAPDHLLVDSLVCPDFSIPFQAFTRGDARSLSIAAASILAKVARDALMADLALEFPGYGFEIHKGYGTARHRTALTALGPCEQHRRTFRPVRAQIERLL
jgi:ribonuclease HII